VKGGDPLYLRELTTLTINRKGDEKWGLNQPPASPHTSNSFCSPGIAGCP